MSCPVTYSHQGSCSPAGDDVPTRASPSPADVTRRQAHTVVPPDPAVAAPVNSFSPQARSHRRRRLPPGMLSTGASIAAWTASSRVENAPGGKRGRWASTWDLKGLRLPILMPAPRCSGPWRRSAAEIQRAKAVCARCPGQRPCLAYALATRQEFGIWGGRDENERRLLHRQWRESRIAASAGPSQP
jgi:hypothetical protein